MSYLLSCLGQITAYCIRFIFRSLFMSFLLPCLWQSAILFFLMLLFNVLPFAMLATTSMSLQSYCLLRPLFTSFIIIWWSCVSKNISIVSKVSYAPWVYNEAYNSHEIISSAAIILCILPTEFIKLAPLWLL